MDGNIVTLKLSEAQRTALLKHQQEFFDPNVAGLLFSAEKKDDTCEIYLTEDQLESLYDDLCRIATNSKNQKTQAEVDDLCLYLENYMPDFEQEEEEEWNDYGD